MPRRTTSSQPVFLRDDDPLPDPAHGDRLGLLAVGGELTRKRLIEAYSRGIFPWYSEGDPVLWWSPSPRLVIFPGELHVPRRLERFIAAQQYEITIDRDFRAVIEACAASPRRNQPGTWITPEMIEAYVDLHHAGHAHSVEFRRDGELAGGIYGVALGRCFFGESMFSRVPNASKTALVHLVRRMQRFQYAFLDCQLPNPHLDQFNPRKIPRALFLELLAHHVSAPEPAGMWTND